MKPKVINRVGRSHKVPFAELLVGLRGGDVELVKNPFLDETLVASGLFVTRGRKAEILQSCSYFKDGRDELYAWVRGGMSRQVSTWRTWSR